MRKGGDWDHSASNFDHTVSNVKGLKTTILVNNLGGLPSVVLQARVRYSSSEINAFIDVNACFLAYYYSYTIWFTGTS
jgi:hypothetical protein